MARLIKIGLVPLGFLLLLLANSSFVQAARGAPGSTEFGFGAILYPRGPLENEALEAASGVGLDWVEVPVDWVALQPNPSIPPQLDALDGIMRYCGEREIAVAFSLTNAPAWAMTPNGPDPAQTVQFVLTLTNRYPATLNALELFPGANTGTGWGAQPDPKSYVNLFRQVHSSLEAENKPLLLVAAGLRPLAANPEAGSVDDLEFLRGMYASGAGKLVEVLSVQLLDLTGDPLTFPSNKERRVLRHYEEVRQVMAANGQQFGVIWITHLSPPSGKIGAANSVVRDAQVNWLSQAYVQLRAQLYVGVVFGQSLNPKGEGADEGELSLLLGAGTFHPFYSVLREMTGLNGIGSVTIKPGKPKEGSFAKKRP